MGKDLNLVRRAKTVPAPTNCLVFAISMKTDHVEFNKGKLYNTIQLFSGEYHITNCCVGQSESCILAFVRFKKPATADIVRSICTTASPMFGPSAIIKT